MSRVTPRSSNEAFSLIKEVVSLGWIKIPDLFKGTGAPGNTLEYLLDVKENNYDLPDLHDWEIKFHGGNALLTLFHKDPSPRGIMNDVVNEFGWLNDRGQVSFRHTIRGQSERGFKIVDEEGKIKVINSNQPNIVPYWDHNIILGSIAAKLRRLILVHGKVKRKERMVIYDRATAYWDLDLISIINAVKSGIILIDFDARTTKGRGSALRNHGTKFRVKVSDVEFLYQNSVVIC